MGTKNTPGDFDCYAAADPDEPLFTLRSTDPLAPHMVRLWAAVRRRHYAEASGHLRRMLVLINAQASKDGAKELEADACADAMAEWKAGHR